MVSRTPWIISRLTMYTCSSRGPPTRLCWTGICRSIMWTSLRVCASSSIHSLSGDESKGSPQLTTLTLNQGKIETLQGLYGEIQQIKANNRWPIWECHPHCPSWGNLVEEPIHRRSSPVGSPLPSNSSMDKEEEFMNINNTSELVQHGNSCHSHKKRKEPPQSEKHVADTQPRRTKECYRPQ